MIKDIPIPEEFYSSGKALLNFSWDIVLSLLRDLDDAGNYGVEAKEVSENFWKAAKQRLATSLAIAQQGIEFILKGKISEISPYLLLPGDPKSWPKRCHKENTSFSDFRTVDAQDLIKIYDSFSSIRLSTAFVEKFENLRKQRNSIIHTIDKNLNVHAVDIISEILAMHKHLFPKESFIRLRQEYLENSPDSELHSADHVEALVIWEISLVLDLLKPSQTQEYFGFNKKQRRYICPHCNSVSMDMNLLPKTALLTPNKPSSKNLYCFVCDQNFAAKRVDCADSACAGNVMSDDYGICATCGDSF